MVKIVLVKKTGELQDSVVKNHDLEHLAKKCGYRKVDNFKMHVNWAVTIEESYYNIELYAKDTGKATFENKYDFPPPIDTLLLFGNCLLLNRNKEGEVCDLELGDWDKVYEFLFGGFEDLDACAAEDDNESDELDEYPDSMKTKQGYLKDGFVVDDPEDEEEQEDEEEDSLTSEEEELSELEEEEYDYDK